MMNASAAWMTSRATLWICRFLFKESMILWSRQWNGAFKIISSVIFWWWQILQRVTAMIRWAKMPFYLWTWFAYFLTCNSTDTDPLSEFFWACSMQRETFLHMAQAVCVELCQRESDVWLHWHVPLYLVLNWRCSFSKHWAIAHKSKYEFYLQWVLNVAIKWLICKAEICVARYTVEVGKWW